jgi:tryptophan synthase alpha chain
MNRIDETFRALRAQGQPALIPFLTAGDPDLDTTRELMRVAADSGADLLELGVPFSDPTADGPVLQRSAEFSLKAGTSLPRVLELVSDFRQASQLPVILYGYYNPIFHYGPERFAIDAQRAGIDGVLIVDLPPEEVMELLTWTKPAGIHFIFLLTPTSGPDRVAAAVRRARGFLYYVSVTGVTGAAGDEPLALAGRAAAELRRIAGLPVVVGFGVDSGKKAKLATDAGADGVVVGTAVVRAIELGRTDAERKDGVRQVISGIRAGLDG